MNFLNFELITLNALLFYSKSFTITFAIFSVLLVRYHHVVLASHQTASDIKLLHLTDKMMRCNFFRHVTNRKATDMHYLLWLLFEFQSIILLP